MLSEKKSNCRIIYTCRSKNTNPTWYHWWRSAYFHESITMGTSVFIKIMGVATLRRGRDEGVKSEKGKYFNFIIFYFCYLKKLKWIWPHRWFSWGKSAQNSRCHSMCLSVFEDFPTIKKKPHNLCVWLRGSHQHIPDLAILVFIFWLLSWQGKGTDFIYS